MAVIVHSYPFGLSAGISRSADAPEILRQYMQPLLRKHYAIAEWKTTPITNGGTDETVHGIHHYGKVVDALTALGKDIAATQLCGNFPITVGGDHSQGFSTIKASMLSHVIGAIKEGRLKVHFDRVAPEWRANLTEWHLLESMQEKSVEGLAAQIDGLVDAGAIEKTELRKILDEIAVVWFDSHGDFNIPATSSSGNFHGMALAAAAGLKVGRIEQLFGKHLKINPRNIYLLAARDLDDEEKKILQNIYMDEMGNVSMYEPQYESEEFPEHVGINFQDMSVIRAVGETNPTKQTLAQVLEQIYATNPEKKFIMSLDVDGMDASFVPGTGTPVGTGSKRNPNIGPTLADACDAFKDLVYRPNILAVDITESSPGKGPVGQGRTERARTLRSAARLLGSVVGLSRESLNAHFNEHHSWLEVLAYQSVAREVADTAFSMRH